MQSFHTSAFCIMMQRCGKVFPAQAHQVLPWACHRRASFSMTPKNNQQNIICVPVARLYPCSCLRQQNTIQLSALPSDTIMYTYSSALLVHAPPLSFCIHSCFCECILLASSMLSVSDTLQSARVSMLLLLRNSLQNVCDTNTACHIVKVH